MSWGWCRRLSTAACCCRRQEAACAYVYVYTYTYAYLCDYGCVCVWACLQMRQQVNARKAALGSKLYTGCVAIW